MLYHVHRFRRWAGIDRAVFFSNAAQLTRLFTGPVTMLLVLKYLTPEVQGYFYAFAGIVAMQVFLEMGFSQNILQFASHEYARLKFNAAGTLEGDLAARSRLISLGRLAFKYYAVAAILFFAAVGVGGHVFFTIAAERDPANHVVPWQWAWWLVTAAAAGSLAINPAWSLLQGCNQVAVVAKYNFWAALAVFGANAIGLILGAGIYVCAIGALVNVLLAAGYLLWRWRGFFRQFREVPRHSVVSWRHEIWPFQWRIAVSWMSGYFVFDIINPIAFYFCGAVEAGRLGMSLQLVKIIGNVALQWIYTKGPQFGMLVARKAWAELDTLWRRSTIQVFVFYLLGYGAFLVTVPSVGHWIPKIPERLAPFAVNAWLGGAGVTQILVGCMAMELRAHKKEPLMWLSVANAILSLALMVPLARAWGITGEAMGYALSLWAIFLPSLRIYQVKRKEYRQSGQVSAAV